MYSRFAALATGIALVAAVPAAWAQATISLNFRDAEIDSVIGAFGHLLNKTFVLDPRVRGKITLETPRAVSHQQAYELLQTVLRQQGFAIVDLGGMVKVVPEPEAKLQSGPVNAGRGVKRGGDQVVTQIFTLNHESASNLVPILRPLISPNNTIAAYPNNNSLVITDYAGNLQRLARIIASLDTPQAAGDVVVIPVKNSTASDVAVAVQRLLDGGSGPMMQPGAQMPGAMVDPGQRVSVFADTRTNSVLLRSASAAKLQMARNLVERLDRPAPDEQANMRVVFLKNAEAVKLAEVLRAVLTGEAGGGQQGNSFQQSAQQVNGLQQNASMMGGQNGQNGMFGAGQPLQQNNQQGPVTVAAGGAVIAADPATNSLIITAPEPVYRNIRAVIDKLDTRRAQVYIETLIVEVNADKSSELGIQWQFLTAPSADGGNSVIGGTNLPARNSGGNIIDASANPLSLGTGLNIGLVRAGQMLGAGGVATAINLGVLARALVTTVNANIKATPNLLTLDNEEARIIIGQNVPFVTGQYTGVAGSAVANPFQTIERKDVGTSLRVRPQVSEGGVVKMQIFQEVSSVQDNSNTGQGPITNRRAIESNVLVDDGQIVVLGGLIQDRIDGSVGKVPLLGDIPILGNLFRYDTRKHTRTNLLVFLRPVIIRDEQSAWDVTASRYDYIRATSEAHEMSGRFGMGKGRTPDMIDMPSRPGSAGGDPRQGPASFWPEVQLRPESREPDGPGLGAPAADSPILDEMIIRKRGSAADDRSDAGTAPAAGAAPAATLSAGLPGGAPAATPASLPPAEPVRGNTMAAPAAAVPPVDLFRPVDRSTLRRAPNLPPLER